MSDTKWEPVEYRATVPEGTCRVTWLAFEWNAVVNIGYTSKHLGTFATPDLAQREVDLYLAELRERRAGSSAA